MLGIEPRARPEASTMNAGDRLRKSVPCRRVGIGKQFPGSNRPSERQNSLAERTEIEPNQTASRILDTQLDSRLVTTSNPVCDKIGPRRW